MNANDYHSILNYLSRVSVRGFADEEELVKLMNKVKKHINRTNKSNNVYTDASTKAA
jgi:hypothetical protein